MENKLIITKPFEQCVATILAPTGRWLQVSKNDRDQWVLQQSSDEGKTWTEDLSDWDVVEVYRRDIPFVLRPDLR